MSATITPVFAEEHHHHHHHPPDKKPIYDSPPATDPPGSPVSSHTPTPTDRLAAHIRTGRLFLTDQASDVSKRLDDAFTVYHGYESAFASTISRLVPPKTSHEQVVPGVLYVAVASMGGSIVARNRLFPIRALTPVGVGVGAAWYFLPETSKNVADLLWEYELKVPAVAEGHLAARKAVLDAWKLADENVKMGRKAVDEGVAKGREIVEGWVKKG